MKKLLTILSLLLCIKSFSQTLYSQPYQRQGATNVMIENLGGFSAKGVFLPPLYTDTSQANLSYAKNYPGNVIRVGNSLWMRSADTKFWFKLNAQTSFCTPLWGFLEGNIAEQLDLIDSLNAREPKIALKNIADTHYYYWDGYKTFKNLYDAVRKAMNVSFDSSKGAMTYNSPSNQILYRGNLSNFDSLIGKYGGIYRYNTGSTGNKPTATGSGIVTFICFNDSNVFNGTDNAVMFAVDRNTNGMRSRNYNGSIWTNWIVALDSTFADQTFLKLTGGTINGYITQKVKSASPPTPVGELTYQVDGSNNLRIWHPNTYFLKFDFSTMTGNVTIDPTLVTQAGNTFNTANNIMKVTASNKIPALDGSLITAINPLLGISTSGSSAAFYSLRTNSGNTALQYYGPIKHVSEQTYTLTPIWTGTTAPSGTTTFSYRWSQHEKTVNLWINLKYSTGGVANTAVAVPIPSDLPIPKTPSGFNSTGDIIGVALGNISTGIAIEPSVATSFLYYNGTDWIVKTVISMSVNAKAAWVYITYDIN